MRINLAGPIVSILLLAAIIPWAVSYFGAESILDSISRLSPATAALIMGALLTNGLIAAYRFKVASGATGHQVPFREAITSVAAGSLGGALFFQLAGQLMARGFVMRRGAMPFAAIVAVTLYERIAAAALSGALALAGAFYIFGRVYLDQQAGGLIFVKLVCGLLVAAAMAAIFGFGRLAKETIGPLITGRLLERAVQFLVLTLLVQIPVMVAYVVATHALAPAIGIDDLIAASTIVMFAASVPISFAGWGVRELSAIFALGAIGVVGHDALTAAVVIGLASMASMALLLVFGVSTRHGNAPVGAEETIAIDYAEALAWMLPIIAAVCVLFQIYVPLSSGLLNVNLADPVAMLAGSLFVLHAIKHRQWPQWRVGRANLFALLATLALGGSLLLGASRFGWTEWALINRFLGWFVLLAFAATGATIAAIGGRDGIKVMGVTYVAATMGVALVELSFIALAILGVRFPEKFIDPGNLQAFALNRNFFAFQLLMATAAGLVLVDKRALRIAMLAVVLAAIWYTGSRSGWLSMTAILAAAVYLRAVTLKEIAFGLICAGAVLGLMTHFLPVVHILLEAIGAGGFSARGPLGPPIVPSDTSTVERMMTLTRGWQMFTEHPIFGAGLGAFRNLNIVSDSKIPLVIHSTALWLAAELGLVGFLVFAVPGFYVWITEWRRAKAEPLAAMIALCLVAFAVMSGPADMVYQRTFWLLIGAALALPGQWQRTEA